MPEPEDAPGAPTPAADPAPLPRPDEIDTLSPGLEDESGQLPVSDDDLEDDRGSDEPTDSTEPPETDDDAAPTEVATGEPAA